jgi:hypothetical protein
MGGRISVEGLQSIDVRDLNRRGAFKGSSPDWIAQFPFLGLRTSHFLIEYRDLNSPADRPPQHIPVQWTRCTYGGARPWFTCSCGRRCGKLYYGNGFLGCRSCGEMIYESQRRSRRGRLHLKATRIRARLRDYGRPGIDPIPSRPSGMRRKTYDCLRTQAEVIERALMEGRIYRPRPRREQLNYARRA